MKIKLPTQAEIDFERQRLERGEWNSDDGAEITLAIEDKLLAIKFIYNNMCKLPVRARVHIWRLRTEERKRRLGLGLNHESNELLR